MPQQRLESGAGRCRGRDRRHSGGFLLRIMPPSWHPVPACTPRLCCRRTVLRCRNGRCRRNYSTLRQRPYAGGTVLFAAKKIRIGRGIVVAMSFRRRAVLLAGTIALHRFSISSPDLRIDAAIRSKQGQSVHRFSISSPDLRIDAAKRSNLGQSVHRFLISSPDLAIAATMHPCPAPENSQRFRI